MAGVDVEAILRRAEMAKSSLQSPEAKAPEKPVEGRGPLGGAWLEGTRLGEEGPVEDAGKFLQEHWDGVSAAAPEECGVLGAPGQEKDGGPPDRTTRLGELQVSSKGEVHGTDVSALHCAFKLLFEVQQLSVNFHPDLNMNAIGQKESGAAEDLFTNLVHTCNLIQNISRDVRNLGYSRFGKEKCGAKDVSVYARKVAKDVNEHAASLKKYLNETMVDSIR
eukprot:CAMPEP_0117541004 /NCGR_PEP_ID=MMETSP0784-20121206/43792_1 /TAXON_ID=39447 /ORGANISM="" /LENGTH=220 /DNA_ID=CAMNT_0005337679 /DNA_START=10 /DNA_END=672 /DNA_ORIENTATION=+